MELRNKAERASLGGGYYAANDYERAIYDQHIDEATAAKYIAQSYSYVIKAVSNNRGAISVRQSLLNIRRFTGKKGIEEGTISSAFSKLNGVGCIYRLNVKKSDLTGIEVFHYVSRYFIFKEKFSVTSRLTKQEEHIKALRILRSTFHNAAIETKVGFVMWIKKHSSRKKMEEWARKQN